MGYFGRRTGADLPDRGTDLANQTADRIAKGTGQGYPRPVPHY
jgi:hypothetical protein